MIDRQELKALIREVLGEVERERDEQRSISEYYAVEAVERRTKREAREKADADLERRRLEDRICDLEREKWGKR